MFPGPHTKQHPQPHPNTMFKHFTTHQPLLQRSSPPCYSPRFFRRCLRKPRSASASHPHFHVLLLPAAPRASAFRQPARTGGGTSRRETLNSAPSKHTMLIFSMSCGKQAIQPRQNLPCPRESSQRPTLCQGGSASPLQNERARAAGPAAQEDHQGNFMQ